MKLNVKQLKESPGQFFPLEWTESWYELDYKGRPLAFTQSVHVQGRAFYHGGILYVSAQLTTEIGVECSRCLKPLVESVHLVESLQFEEEPETGFKGMLLDGFGFEHGLEELELRPYLEKLIAASLKSKPLCRPDCRGLCPTCGQDLNDRACGCATQRSVDPRLEKLKQLLD